MSAINLEILAPFGSKFRIEATLLNICILRFTASHKKLRNKAIRGTGVGLYTSWRIILLHGGKIDARSDYGRWAEFSFTVPEKPSPH